MSSLPPAHRVVTPKPVVESVLDWKNAFCVECGKKSPLVSDILYGGLINNPCNRYLSPRRRLIEIVG